MNKKQPFISVVIPAYNEANYLPDCLSALQNQSYPTNRFEIVVIDNNSNDATPRLAKKYGARVITEKQQGHVFAFRTGIGKARGDIIAVTDADTIVSAHWLQTIANSFEDKDVVGATGFIRYVGGSAFMNYLISTSYYLFLQGNWLVGKAHTTGCNLAIRKIALEKIKGVDIRYRISGDVDLGMQLRCVGKVVLRKDLVVASSLRRFTQKAFFKEVLKYVDAYFCSIWLRRPPHSVLVPIR